MTYLYRHKSGEAIERDFQGSAPEALRVKGKTYRKERILAPAVHAHTLVGEDLHKVEARQHRMNKEAAEGLVKGTMREPDDRPVNGDKQPREAKRQFNDMVASAKMGLSIG